MKRFLLDTNICLAYIRGHALYKQVENQLGLSNEDAIVLISVVTKAELMALGMKRGWERKKLAQLDLLLRKLIILDISESDEALIQAYAEIDAFSQGKLKTSPLGGSAKNMGKNDLWIAASARVAAASLVTTDGDFDHLNDVWFQVYKF